MKIGILSNITYTFGFRSPSTGINNMLNNEPRPIKNIILYLRNLVPLKFWFKCGTKSNNTKEKSNRYKYIELENAPIIK